MDGKYVKGNAFYVPARVHYVCHILLAKMYGGKNWHSVKQMGAKVGRQTSKMYEVARRIHASNMSIVMTGENNPAKRPEVRKIMSEKQKANPVFLGKTRPDHSEAMRGINNPMFGKTAHTYGIVKHSAESMGKSLEEIHGLEKGIALRSKMKSAQKNVDPVWARSTCICDVCGKSIVGKGNLKQHVTAHHKEKLNGNNG
jgi:hypothetical protein